MIAKLLKINEAKKTIEALEEACEGYRVAISELEGQALANEDFVQDLHGVIAERGIEIETLQKALDEANAKVAKLEGESLKATAQAADIVASVGADTPVEEETAEDKAKETLLSEFTSLTDPKAKVEFYQKHRNKLLNKE